MKRSRADKAVLIFTAVFFLVIVPLIGLPFTLQPILIVLSGL